MYTTAVYAQDAGGEFLIQLLPMFAIFAIFYFLVIRPHQRKLKDHQSKISAVRRGDRVVTGGGIYGKVIKVGDDDKLQVEIADGVRIEVVKSTLADVVSKTEPATTDKK